MNNVKNDDYYMNKIIKDMNFIASNMSGASFNEFEENEVLQDSMMFRLIQISENAKALSDSFKKEHMDVPWSDIYGLRNRIVHEYGNVDMTIVYETLKKDIPEVLDLLEV